MEIMSYYHDHGITPAPSHRTTLTTFCTCLRRMYYIYFHCLELAAQTQDDGGCFNSTSSVLVQGTDGKVTRKSLENLKVGDSVEGYDHATNTVIFSAVYFITYQSDNQTLSILRRLFYKDNDDDTVHSLAIHPKHLVYAHVTASLSSLEADVFLASPPSNPVMSENVKVGDFLWIKDASDRLCPKRVIKVDEILAHVRHPLTFSHNIIVDGVLASVHVGHEHLMRFVTCPLRLVYNISPSFNDSWFTKKMVKSWDEIEKYLVG